MKFLTATESVSSGMVQCLGMKQSFCFFFNLCLIGVRFAVPMEIRSNSTQIDGLSCHRHNSHFSTCKCSTQASESRGMKMIKIEKQVIIQFKILVYGCERKTSRRGLRCPVLSIHG